MKIAKIKYKNKILQQVKEGKRGSSYSALKKMSLRSDQVNKNTFTLPFHQSQAFSAQQSADIIASYFAEISREFDPQN